MSLIEAAKIFGGNVSTFAEVAGRDSTDTVTITKRMHTSGPLNYTMLNNVKEKR